MNDIIVLASSSPRRIEMMEKNGFHTVIMPAEIDETLPEGIGMEDAVMFLSLKKALASEKKALENNPELKGHLLIAADTVVYKDGIMGKPEDRDDARKMLLKLKDTCHYVCTGVTLLKIGEDEKHVFYETTKVYVRDFSDEDLEEYLDTDEPYDKAGAYAIQGLFAEYIDRYEGDFNTVVGFPLDRIRREMEKMA